MAGANGEPENEEEGKKAAESWQKIEAVFGWSPNSDEVPEGKQPGDTVQLIVRYANPKEIAFRYPTEQDMAKQQKGPKK